MIVISDMMGTLTIDSPAMGMVDWVRHHQSITQARWLIASMLPGYLLAKMGLVDMYPWLVNLGGTAIGNGQLPMSKLRLVNLDR